MTYIKKFWSSITEAFFGMLLCCGVLVFAGFVTKVIVKLFKFGYGLW